MKLTPEQKVKYSARNWAITSPGGRYSAVMSWNKAVSLHKLERMFPADWTMRPLFPSERETAQRKIDRMRE